MNAKDQFHRVMNFEAGKSLKWEFGYWAATMRRWYEEGLEKKAGIPEETADGAGVHGGAAGWRPGRPNGTDANQVCQLDEGLQRLKCNNYLAPLFEEKVLEEQESWVIVRNDIGMTEKRSKTRGSLSSYIEGPVKTRDDWEKLKTERLQPSLDHRLPENWDELLSGYTSRTFPLALGGGQGFFGTPRFLLGELPVLTIFYDQPDLIRQIISDLADFWIALYDQLLDLVDVDLVMIWEDICYNNGPLISPDTFREFMLPGYKKLTRFLMDRGVKNIIVDSDGDVWKLLPLFLEGGVTGLYPFEVKAGMDVVEVRKVYPKLQMLGGFSKAALITGKDEIDVELDLKIPWMLEQGGYIPYMDHLVPPDVSWENFYYYRTKLNGLIDRAAAQQ
jgi:uroporphyrinogen decarboxylase